MIQITDIKIPLGNMNMNCLTAVSAKTLKISPSELKSVRLTKKSIDARKKDNVHFVCAVECEVKNPTVEKQILSRRLKNVSQAVPFVYRVEKTKPLSERPIVVGSGPAGLFAALVLTMAGQRPIILERGGDVQSRRAAVERYFAGGELDTVSNIQFGEGGAGTFSDGKLTTGTKDRRIRFVLEQFVRAGANEEILYNAKPHVGTDVLLNVIKNLRSRITASGGEYRFFTQLTDICVRDGRLVSVTGTKNGEDEIIPADSVILATGHSARDTFEMLHRRGIPMIQKPFAVGARIEHPQTLINTVQFGEAAGHPELGAADYKLAVHLPDGRGVYTFCMCPGGHVVAAASEPESVVTNGMSLFARDGVNANSALLVSVNPTDFGSEHPLAGVEFQRRIERAAFACTRGSSAPAQLVGDLLDGRPSVGFGDTLPTYRPSVALGEIGCCLPSFIIDSMKSGLLLMDQKLHGFARHDAILTAPETRSSSPVRILRDEKLQSPAASGLYPCGEGAGFAGGIMSAAVDGIKCAETILRIHTEK